MRRIFNFNYMKYKLGDKVKYDGGDWWFYGTVSAVFDHSISPCYRISVEKMEKKICKFSITQFEFELEPQNDVVIVENEKRKWDNPEIEILKKYYGVLGNDDLSRMLKRSSQEIEDKWKNLKPEQKKVAEEAVPASKASPQYVKVGRRPRTKRNPETNVESKLETKTENVESTTKTRQSKGKAWDANLEAYLKGEKSSKVNAWVADNRRLNRKGKLSEEKIERLTAINFPFATVYNKRK